jgi:hypothetical protein
MGRGGEALLAVVRGIKGRRASRCRPLAAYLSLSIYLSLFSALQGGRFYDFKKGHGVRRDNLGPVRRHDSERGE